MVPCPVRRGFWSRLIARGVILALLFALVPVPAQASLSLGGEGELGLPQLASRLPEDVPVLLVCVVISGPNVTESAFGELLAHTGTDPQPYAFTGEPLDPNSGWQYHRARWMDPSVGRFAGMDPFEGGSSKPTSLHRYLYADSAPVDATDPTGLVTLAAAMTAMSGFTNAIFGIAVPGQGTCGKKCGPDITAPLRSVMAWVDRDFEGLSEDQQDEACATVVNRTGFSGELLS